MSGPAERDAVRVLVEPAVRLLRRLQRSSRPPALGLFVGWCALIFFLSAQPVEEPGSIHHPVRAWFQNLLHAPEYGVYAVLFLWATARAKAPLASAPGRVALAVLAVLVYGALDEWHQSFTFGRDASVFDVLTDLAGGWLAAALVRALEQPAPHAHILRVLVIGVPACVLGALIATFVPDLWPGLTWL